MDECELDSMTVQELRELRERIDDAIRAEIARERKARTTKDDPAPKVETIDLELERDAWAARRR